MWSGLLTNWFIVRIPDQFVKIPDDMLGLMPSTPTERPAPLLRLLALTTQQLARSLHQRIRAAGYDDQRPADDAAFAHIPPEGIRLTDLARRAGVTKQSMAELVASLEARGYVERTSDPADGRAKLIVFTERGWGAVSTALDALDDIERDLVERYGPRRVGDLRRLLHRVLDDGAPGGPSPT